jgi:hypothetical protein
MDPEYNDLSIRLRRDPSDHEMWSVEAAMDGEVVDDFEKTYEIGEEVMLLLVFLLIEMKAA